MAAMQRLYPPPAEDVPADAVYAALDWPAPGADRPYVALNMVSTVDGKAAVAGVAAGIGTATDRELMRQLRAQADAVLAGVGSLRAEAFTPAVPAAYVPARVARGLAPQPMGVLVSGSGRLPLERRYFQRDDYPRVLLTSAAGAATLDPAAAARLRVVVTGEHAVDLAAGLRVLRAELGVRWLLCEGGPTLNHALLAAGLVDELFLTLAPRLAGGLGPTIVQGSALPGVPLPLRLVTLHAEADELFLRYRLSAHSAA
jgi:riboflavin-specific deaminase-like protein